MTRILLSLSDRIAIEEKSLEQHIAWIGSHEGKSSVVLGLGTAMLGFLATSAPNADTWTTTMVALASLSVGLLALSFTFVHVGTYPRTRGPQSLIFFGAVASLRIETYRQQKGELTQEDYLEDLMTQSHTVATIAAHKFAALKWAYRLLLVAIVPWATCILLFKLTA